MSATDELRRLLDERGVEWRDYHHDNRTWWSDDNNVGWFAEGRPAVTGSYVKIEAVLTPEQAIAATLGSEINGETSDGYHTFNELYHHRAVLFSVIVRDHSKRAWKARKHHDGTMYDGMFIVGIETPSGQATYHYDLDPYWGMFDCEEREFAPEWDGHTPDEAIARIATLGGQPAKLTAEQVREAIMSADRWEKPMGNTGLTNTHLIIRDDGWQAIADELNAALGSGTCENIAPDYLDFLCSKCGFVHYHSDENDTGDGNDWAYCPKCGKAVKR